MSLICLRLHIFNHKVWQVFLLEIFGELGIQVDPTVQGTLFLSASEKIQTNKYPNISVEEKMTTNERKRTFKYICTSRSKYAQMFDFILISFVNQMNI